MQLHVKITPLCAGTAEPVGPSEILLCPADVGPDTVRSFLVRHPGEPTEVAWTRSERHERLAIGWIFPAGPPDGPGSEVEVLCVPFIDDGEGSVRPMFEVLADQRREFERLAETGALDSLTVVEEPLRQYAPGAIGLPAPRR